MTSNISTKITCLEDECGYEWNIEQNTQLYAATLPIDTDIPKSGNLCKQLENYFSKASTYDSCCKKCHERKNTGKKK